jgi:hypothetical protein
VVEGTHSAIAGIIPPGGIQDSEIMKHHQEVCKILQEGAAKLNAEMVSGLGYVLTC